MPMNRREFLAASAAGAAMLKQGMTAFAAPTGNIQVTIDASKIGEPVNPMIFGGYMEPATTQVWAEMLTDRKFANPVTDAQRGGAHERVFPPLCRRAIQAGRAGRNGRNGHGAAVCRRAQPARQAGRLRAPRHSAVQVAPGPTARLTKAAFILPAIPGAKVVVRLVWGTGAGDSQTITIPSLSREYQKFPLKFTAGGRHGGCAPGNPGYRQRHVSHRDRFADACRQRAGISRRNDPALQRSGFQDVQVARRQLRLRVRLARRAWRPG